jgi:FkbM family methyltransferase
MITFRSGALHASRLIAQNCGPVSRLLYIGANAYVRSYKNLNYDMTSNGEFYILDRLPTKEMSTIFDVGANIGDYTSACLGRFRSDDVTIHAFEPVPATFEKLSANVASPHVRRNAIGLSNCRQMIEINYNPLDSGSSSIFAGELLHQGHWDKVQVEVMTGDEYCAENGEQSIDLLKIDVEGAENLVLEGFSGLLESEKISCIQFEFGMVNIHTKFLLKDFWDILNKRGFVLGPVMPRGVIFKDYNPRDEDFQGPSNYLAVHGARLDLIEAVRRR